MGTYTITSTTEQDAGIEFAATKKGIVAGEYLQNVFSKVFDSYVKQLLKEKSEEVQLKYEKAPLEVKVEVELSLKDVLVSELKK